jgi:predicted solute-binding protein
MTGLPFVYAAWTGRPGPIDAATVDALQAAQADGVAAAAAIAEEYGAGDAGRARRAAVYLRDNVKYGLGPEEAAGLQMFLDLAAGMDLAPRRRVLEFF